MGIGITIAHVVTNGEVPNGITNPTQRKVWKYLWRNLGYEASTAIIAGDLGLHVRTVQKALRALERMSNARGVDVQGRRDGSTTIQWFISRIIGDCKGGWIIYGTDREYKNFLKEIQNSKAWQECLCSSVAA